MQLQYDDTNLRKLFAELEPKQRRKALKGAFRKSAGRVRKVAVSKVRASGLNNADQLSKGVRSIVFKRDAGFRVTVASRKANKKGKGESGMHQNRKGLKKPILIWAEGGTNLRRTKSRTRIFRRARKGHSTGRMRPYRFMEKTMRQVENTIPDELRNDIAESIQKVAKKYGCK